MRPLRWRYGPGSVSNFETDVHRQLIGSIEDLLRAIAALATSPGDSVVNQLTVLRDLSRAENQEGLVVAS